MKKMILRKVLSVLALAATLSFAGCSDLAENELESSVTAGEESSSRATISSISSFYADDLSHGTFTSNVTCGNYTI